MPNSALDGLGHGNVILIPTGTHRRYDLGLSESLAVANRPELDVTIAMADKPGDVFAGPVFRCQRHRERISGQGLVHLGRHLPAHDLPMEHVQDEHRVHPPRPRRHVCNIGDP